MGHWASATRAWRAVLVVAAALALAGCGGKTGTADNAATASPASSAADISTVAGVKLASFTSDPAKGKTVFATCMACHSLDAGVNVIGPSLHGVVGRRAGAAPGFGYSAAMSGSGITWTPDKLFQFIEDPQRVVPGTAMGYPGDPDPQTRADLIAYLATVR